MDITQINHPAFRATEPDYGNVKPDTYRFISTEQQAKDLESLGFKLINFSGSLRGRGLGQHMMEFTHPNMPKLDGLDMRLYSSNSHNGTTSQRLGIGILRIVCSNGMVGISRNEEARIIHRGYALDKVRVAVDAIMAKFSSVIQTVKTMQDTQLPTDSLAGFVFEASKLRDVRPYSAEEFVAIRRHADAGTDLWTVFNRVQESLVRGGYRTQQIALATPVSPLRITPGPKAKELISVGAKLQVNQKLWELAQQYLNVR